MINDQQNKKVKENPVFYRISFLICFIMAVFLIRCEGDHSPQNTVFHNPLANPQDGPPAGNPDGNSPIPPEAGPVAVSSPDHIIGDGTRGVALQMHL